ALRARGCGRPRCVWTARPPRELLRVRGRRRVSLHAVRGRPDRWRASTLPHTRYVYTAYLSTTSNAKITQNSRKPVYRTCLGEKAAHRVGERGRIGDQRILKVRR